MSYAYMYVTMAQTKQYQNFVALEGTLDNLHVNYNIITLVDDSAFLFRLSSHIMM